MAYNIVINELTLYKSDIVPNKNMGVENIEYYLSTLTGIHRQKYSNKEVMLLNFNLNTTLTIEYSYTGAFKFFYNYLRVKYANEGNELNPKYLYYFITKAEPMSNSSVKLYLTLDTINTYKAWEQLDDRTKIIREHEDRYYKYEGEGGPYYNGTLLRKVDKYNETENSSKYKVSSEDIEAPIEYPKDNYYLLYKGTDNPKDGEVNPIQAYFCSDSPMKIRKGFNKPTITYTTTELDNLLTRNGVIAITGIEGNHSSHVKVYYNNNRRSREYYLSKNEILVYIRNGDAYNFTNHTIFILYYNYNSTTNTYEFISADGMPLYDRGDDVNYSINKIDFISSDFIHIINGDVINNSYSDMETEYHHYINENNKFSLESGRAEEIFTKRASEISRYNPSNIKLFKLPYPIDGINYDADENVWLYSENRWNYDETTGLLKFNNIGDKFSQTYLAFPKAREFGELLKHETHKKDPHTQFNPNRVGDDLEESKLFHSNFYEKRYVYDSFSLSVGLEHFNPDTTDLANWEEGTFDIEFYYTSAFTGNFLFYFSLYDEGLTDYELDTDHQDILYIKRNNEVPIFSSEYINYLNNGYNYDKKNAQRNTTMSWLNTGLQTAGGILSLVTSGATAGKSLLAGSELFSSGIESFTSTIMSQQKGEEDIQRKLNSSLMNAPSISASDDIDLLSVYKGDKLKKEVFTISKEMKETWVKFFHFFGYSHPTYGRPNYKSRYWFNFIQCESDFIDAYDDDPSMPLEVKEDLDNRFKIGVTIYHERKGEYDLWNYYENYETWRVQE